MFKLQNYFLALIENQIWISNAIQKFNMSSEYIMREIVAPANVLCVIYDLVKYPRNFAQLH